MACATSFVPGDGNTDTRTGDFARLFRCCTGLADDFATCTDDVDSCTHYVVTCADDADSCTDDFATRIDDSDTRTGDVDS